jgi:hypothetical protein
MNRSKQAAKVKRAAPVAPIPNEAKPLGEGLRQVYGLISSGHLPPADTVTKDGKPAWSFENLAVIVGCEVDELARLLSRKPARFSIDPGARH